MSTSWLASLSLVVLPLWLTFNLATSDLGFEGAPAPGSTVTNRLAKVTVTFPAAVVVHENAPTPIVQVRGPHGNFFNLGCAGVGGATAFTSVSLGESGTYQVSWVISPALSGSYSFEYIRAEDAGVSPGTAIPPCDPSYRPTTSASTVSDADMASARRTTTVAIALITVVVLSISTIHVIKRKRRNRTRESE